MAVERGTRCRGRRSHEVANGAGDDQGGKRERRVSCRASPSPERSSGDDRIGDIRPEIGFEVLEIAP